LSQSALQHYQAITVYCENVKTAIPTAVHVPIRNFNTAEGIEEKVMGKAVGMVTQNVGLIIRICSSFSLDVCDFCSKNLQARRHHPTTTSIN